MVGKSRTYQLLVVASSVIALFAVAGCGAGGTSDDEGLTHDSVVTDSVDLTDVVNDVVVSDDGRPLDINTPDSVDDPGTDSTDVSCSTCTGGKICVEGECQCPATQKDCDGTCTTLGTNENCSGCGDTCPTGGSCESGNCECPGAQVNCSGTCTILGTDENCSECYDACVGVKSCQDGECVAEVDPDCVSATLCVTDDDCESGSRCNQAMDFPACQKLYCGGYGTACSEDYFCLSKICWDDACTNDCDDLECGPDPVYGESCGVCQEGATCRSNVCECELQDHFGCCGSNICWIDSCGRKGEVVEGCPLACLDGECADCEDAGLVNCSGKCKSLGTNTDCSECGDICPEGGGCNSGACQCDYGEMDCDGVCTEIYTELNCLGCGDACPEGGTCYSPDSGCECPSDEANCNGICTFVGTEVNCSGCGDECGSMVVVPAGSFKQGCSETLEYYCQKAAGPYHYVALNAFEIDKFEVTVGMYKKCVDAGICTAPSTDKTQCNWGVPGKSDNPVNCIDWYQSRDYCEWADKRLCTESEWEKAARGTDERIFPWGNETGSCDYCVFSECDIGDWGTTWPVGSRPAGASPYGALDMAGNVDEWIEDDFHSDYTGAPTNGNAWVDEPRASERVTHGGSYRTASGKDVSASGRYRAPPAFYDNDLGFRCCRSESFQ